MQAELFCSGELAHVGAHAVEFLAADAVGDLEHTLADVEDAVVVQAKAVRLVGPINQKLDIAANVLGELLEKDLGLLLSQWSHGGDEK